MAFRSFLFSLLPAFPQQLDEVAQVACCHARANHLAWRLHHSPKISPILGTSSLGHLRENLAATDIRLGVEARAYLG